MRVLKDGRAIVTLGGVKSLICYTPSREGLRLLQESYAPTYKSPRATLEEAAEGYARWLANRDGIAIPPGARAFMDWAVPEGLTKKDKRVRAVDFRGGWYGSPQGRKQAQWTVTIPHWDAVREEP